MDRDSLSSLSFLSRGPCVEHLKREWSIENLLFYKAVQTFRALYDEDFLAPLEQRLCMAEEIYYTYIVEDAPSWVRTREIRCTLQVTNTWLRHRARTRRSTVVFRSSGVKRLVQKTKLFPKVTVLSVDFGKVVKTLSPVFFSPPTRSWF